MSEHIVEVDSVGNITPRRTNVNPEDTVNLVGAWDGDVNVFLTSTGEPSDVLFDDSTVPLGPHEVQPGAAGMLFTLSTEGSIGESTAEQTTNGDINVGSEQDEER